MSERRAWRLDLAAAGLGCAGLFLAAAVFTYDPADLPGTVYPPNPQPRNLLGVPGAGLAQALVQTLGAAVYAWLASWFALVVLLVLRRGLLATALRAIGWLLLVPCVAVLARWWGGRVGVSGGSLGDWLSVWLAEQLYPAGQVLVVVACLVLALVLTVDFALRRLLALRRLWNWCAPRIDLPLRRLPAALGRALRPVAAAPGRLFRLLPRLPRRPRAATAAPATTAADAAAIEPAIIPIHHHNGANPGDSGAGLHSERARFSEYKLPPLSLLEDTQPVAVAGQDQQLRERAALLEKTFADFGINVRVVGINTGPVITQYEVALETGLRLHKVTTLADDVALCLRVPSVRMVAPIPGKNTVGVEIPNEVRADVRLKEVILGAGARAARAKIPLFLGKDSEGRPLVHDLTDMPHLLIAGTTGTGKSVCMNTIIMSMLMTRRPDEIKMIMIDPKVVELDLYGKVPHLMHPVVGDEKKAAAVLAWAVDKMEERYDLLRRARVRNIAGYNELDPDEIVRRVAPADDEERKTIPERMPYIVIFVDEMADLILRMKKEAEEPIIRLAQKSRAAGIHLVVATQKPTVDVITGLIKSNLPARICFKVTNKSDSRVVLDEMGADKLLSRGDLLFLQPGVSGLVRAQGAYVGPEEIERVVGHLECDPCYAPELLQLPVDRDADAGGSLQERLRARDDLYEAAVEVVVREGRGSVSLLQRALGIGYGRASRMIDWMAEDGIVGAYNGSNAREVLYTPEQLAALRDAEGAA
jgi:S-DNA-T family DNA segregation ATPase FtsK/SpoIIIE